MKAYSDFPRVDAERTWDKREIRHGLSVHPGLWTFPIDSWQQRPMPTERLRAVLMLPGLLSLAIRWRCSHDCRGRSSRPRRDETIPLVSFQGSKWKWGLEVKRAVMNRKTAAGSRRRRVSLTGVSGSTSPW